MIPVCRVSEHARRQQDDAPIEVGLEIQVALAFREFVDQFPYQFLPNTEEATKLFADEEMKE